MRNVLLVFLAVSATAVAVWRMPHRHAPLPAPTDQGPGEDEDFAQLRAQWIEHLHRHASGVNWRAQDAATRTRREMQRATHRSAMHNGYALQALANVPPGSWIERGAQNWAGRVSAVDYDTSTDRLTVFAHGGQLWRSLRNTLNWQSLNDARHFEPFYQMQNFVRLNGAGPTPERLLVADDTRHGFFYSDDNGASWSPSSGFVPANWLQT